jgi:hypothetical protein
MTAHDRIRLTGPFAELIGNTNDSPGREKLLAGADHFCKSAGQQVGESAGVFAEVRNCQKQDP